MQANVHPILDSGLELRVASFHTNDLDRVSHQSNQVLGKWGKSAVYWEKHREAIQKMFAPITRAMIEDTRLEPNQFVLDVAGGTGEPSLTIAREFGALVSILSTDPVTEMVTAARREARRRGLNNITFCQCAGEELPFESDRFDRTICRLGVMFLPDTVGGLQEMLRVTRPEGRVTLAVWHNREANPIFHIVTDCLARYVPSLPEDSCAPDPFRFAGLGVLASLFRQAGAEEVTERFLQFSIEAPLSIDQFWTVRSEMSETLRDKLAQLTSEQRIQVSDEVKEVVRPFFAEGRMRFPAEVILVTGKKKDDGLNSLDGT